MGGFLNIIIGIGAGYQKIQNLAGDIVIPAIQNDHELAKVPPAIKQFTARFNKQAMELVLEKLDVLGRLLIFTRQMDMLMNTEQSVDDLSKRCLSGCYDLEGPGPG